MSDALLKDRMDARELDAFVVAAGFARGGEAAFALGDGTVRVAAPSGGWLSTELHDGAVLAMATAGAGWVTGGDDGRLRRLSPDGTVAEVAAFGSKWVEQVAAWGDGLLACAVGRAVHVFGAGDAKLKELPHASTVSGIAFDAKGKRVAASHYGGCTLWFVGAKVDSPRTLEWKGSHTGITLHPGGEAVVTAMQESALHGWRLADGQHMRMSGYPSKTAAMSFSRTGKWLATSGAESIVMWPFFGGGPMGKAPTELAGGDGVLCTQVAFHPREEMVAAGFSDGLVVLADVPTARVLQVAAPGHGPVSALAWSGDGARLAFGTETGFAALVDLARRD